VIRQHATITEDHRLRLDDNIRWKAQLAGVKPGRVVVTVQSDKAVHSERQRGYHWGVVVPFFQELWSVPRAAAGLEPYSKDETHYALVLILRGSVDGPLGSKLPVPTRTMTTEEYSALDKDSRELAWTQYQSRLPEPGEPWEDPT
jgi:hypothetical protein